MKFPYFIFFSSLSRLHAFAMKNLHVYENDFLRKFLTRLRIFCNLFSMPREIFFLFIWFILCENTIYYFNMFALFSEQPIFTCQAHVFHIDPKTKRTWITASSKAISVSFFYDSSRNLYRIISVEGTKVRYHLSIILIAYNKLKFLCYFCRL